MHSSWKQKQQQRIDYIPPPSLPTQEQSIRSLDRVASFPQNPSFVAALNRAKTVSLHAVSLAKPVSSLPTNPAVSRTNHAVYGMQRNMFERVKVTGTGCGSCRGNK